MKKLIGTGVALITPFDSQNKIDFKALEELVNFQTSNGIDYLVALGTTAETPTLSLKEKEQVINKIIEVNNKKLPVVLGLGGNNTGNIVASLKNWNTFSFDAILSVSPYYNKPSQEGIYQHYKAISLASELPIILYNVPSRTGSNILPETVIRLANDFENIIGIKEASGNFDQILELIRSKPKNFKIISGDDKLALPMIFAGGVGVISVIGQGFPKEFSKMIRLGINGKVYDANNLFYKLLPAIDLIFEEGNPSGIKSLLNSLGICTSKVRLPLTEVSHLLQEKISNFAKNFK